MLRIGVISDTHSYLDEKVLEYFAECDQIWHAGDIGSLEVTDRLSQIAEVKAVWGNIDDHRTRVSFPENNIFMAEGKKVFIRHICGYPGRYNVIAKQLIREHRPDIVVAGHSHILKVIYDKSLSHLHINPGAAGKSGFQKVRSIVRFSIDGDKLSDMQVIEMNS